MRYLCFDIGGTFVKYGIFNENGKFLVKDKYPTNLETPDNFFTRMASIANQYHKLTAIGISFPGFINIETGVAIRAGALGKLDGKNIIAELQTRLSDSVPIIIENDANCAALAEKFIGNAQDVDNFAVITLGTGVGGGIVINNTVLHGSHFRAGEFGMMITDYSRSGYATLHDLAATSSLLKQVAQIKNVDIQTLTGEQIMSAYDEDQQIQLAVNKWAEFVAIAIFNLVATNDLERILIGGGISQNQKLLPIIKKALEKNPFWNDYRTDINTCRYFNDSGLLGALYIAQKAIERDGNNNVL